LADQPITGKYLEDRIFSDKENIYTYEKSREALQIYSQRTSDIVVVETGLEAGVQTHIIMSPTIYGVGTGLFNKISIQVPALIRAALKAGQAQVIGEGKGVWDYVHIRDLANLYQLLLTKIIAGEQIPSGEKGILFSATGRFSWFELSQGVANALFALKAIETSDVHSLDISTASEKLGGLALLNTELGFASKYVAYPQSILKPNLL
jgi:nucleoside-diphosphate-sugar epimerase